MPDNVIVEKRNTVAIVTLNRPEVRNAFDDVLIADLTRVFGEIERDDGVRVMVLAGAGKAFCAGADLNWMKRMAAYSEAENLRDANQLAALMSTLDRLRKPTIARVQGAAFGGGVGLVACCDLAVAVPETVFCLSEVRLGLIPAVISPYVVQAIGARAARRYFLTAERFGASEARVLGLVSDVVEAGRLDATVQALAAQLLKGGPEAIAASKELIAAVNDRPIDAGVMADTARRIARQRAGAEGREGVAAFLEKRPASWMGS